MSLYNLLFGTNPAAPVLLAMLGITSMDVPRFRDCFLSEGRIVIHTRTGGGNRDDYEEGNDFLTTLPGYLSNSDDEYDCTYANFYFTFPEQFKSLLDKIPEGVNTTKRWQETIEKLKSASPDDLVIKKVSDVLQPLFDKLNDT